MIHIKNSHLQKIITAIRYLSIGSLILFINTLFIASPAYAAEVPLQGKTLIVYYSWGGHTREVANMIQKVTNADIVELQTVKPYPSEYRPTTVQAKKEQEAGFYPPLSTKIENFESYDTVIIGSANWWGTFAMPIFTFLDTYSLEGKNCAVFITHGGSELGRAMDDIQRYTSKSKVYKGLAIADNAVRSSQKKIDTWLKGIAASK